VSLIFKNTLHRINNCYLEDSRVGWLVFWNSILLCGSGWSRTFDPWRRIVLGKLLFPSLTRSYLVFIKWVSLNFCLIDCQNSHCFFCSILVMKVKLYSNPSEDGHSSCFLLNRRGGITEMFLSPLFWGCLHTQILIHIRISSSLKVKLFILAST
jgi:hypothetical protein